MHKVLSDFFVSLFIWSLNAGIRYRTEKNLFWVARMNLNHEGSMSRRCTKYLANSSCLCDLVVQVLLYRIFIDKLLLTMLYFSVFFILSFLCFCSGPQNIANNPGLSGKNIRTGAEQTE